REVESVFRNAQTRRRRRVSPLSARRWKTGQRLRADRRLDPRLRPSLAHVSLRDAERRAISAADRVVHAAARVADVARLRPRRSISLRKTDSRSIIIRIGSNKAAAFARARAS